MILKAYVKWSYIVPELKVDGTGVINWKPHGVTVKFLVSDCLIRNFYKIYVLSICNWCIQISRSVYIFLTWLCTYTENSSMDYDFLNMINLLSSASFNLFNLDLLEPFLASLLVYVLIRNSKEVEERIWLCLFEDMGTFTWSPMT